MLRLELTKTASETSEKEFEGSEAHGTATALRLLEPWFHTNRHSHADSYFASVATAEACFERGFRFTGVVKNATVDFPMKHLSNLEVADRGQHVTMVSEGTDSRPNLLATMWVDRERRYFIS